MTTIFVAGGKPCSSFCKTLGIIALPLNFLIGLGVLGSLLLMTRFLRLGRTLLVLSALMLAVCGFAPVGNLLLYPLESRFPAWSPSQAAPDGIIVLGASIDVDLSAAHGTPVVTTASDRIVVTAVLARKYPGARVVFTGGNANLISGEAKEADFAAGLFESLGIDKSRLILESRARNTYENAQFTKAMVDPKPGERWLLVTSAFHMPRSVGLFRKAGLWSSLVRSTGVSAPDGTSSRLRILQRTACRGPTSQSANGSA